MPLNQKLHLETKTRTADGQGGSTFVYAKTEELYGDIQPLSANQRFLAGRVEGQGVSHMIKTRYIPGTDTTMRLVEEATGRVFEIRTSIDLHENRRYLMFTVEETGEVVSG